ncbi:CRISPR-associated protein Csy2 [Marinomonas gallaica]|uniref:CRISPR-associated protein Csy2 n=1 Tax=Marinomonas gallaica TaxID=1806667 RepID=A0A1C3JSR4_9GAMM|nr:type I-F CRISPR-associated protein Csy2 [Marinomonas gallaica]SBT18145.1 CRISPR-associated protein Csy2 [Marinomonas gallaica]SBT22525.1 CRISPR-associated protein Csy2 [Marinomonas gallaica]
MDKLLVIKHLEVEGANAIAGLTWGFPAITNFLGFTHALQRKVQEKISSSILLEGCAVICHSSQVQTYNNNMSREHYFALTRNPLVLKGKEAVTAPFNEEGKMRMDVSLLIDVKSAEEDGFLEPDDLEDLQELIPILIPTMRLAGGSISKFETAELVLDAGSQNRDDHTRKRFLRQFLPGFALVSRHDVLEKHIEQTLLSPLDAWLDFSTRKMRSEAPEKEGDKAKWVVERPEFSGWLKPIMIGYQGISDLYEAGQVGHVRDRSVPVQFVESIYSLGQWISPHRITNIEHLLWTQSYEAERSLYLCNNAFEPDTSHLLNNEYSNTEEQ